MDNAFHKAQLIRLLIGIVSNPLLSRTVYFKGGTCASLLGYLDRFSVDLDFDISPAIPVNTLRKAFHSVFQKGGFEVKDESKVALDFLVRYENKVNKRNTIKIDAVGIAEKFNIYKASYIPVIDRYVQCQTIETMFAHKLFAVTDRFARNITIAARDLYDIHYFFSQGYTYSVTILEKLSGKKVVEYLHFLHSFIREKFTERNIQEDLNVLLPFNTFNKVRKTLKQEVLFYIENEKETRV